jgi:hypothetical protein
MQSNDCLWEQRDCFLAQKPWEEACDPSTLVITGTEPTLIMAIAEYRRILVQLTVILRRTFHIIDAMQLGEPVDPKLVAAQYWRSSRLKARIHKWFPEIRKHWEPPVEKLSEDPHTLWHVVLWWDNKWHGSMSMGAWAALMIVQETLKVCSGGKEDYTERNKEITSDILRSVECVASGLTGMLTLPGPFFLSRQGF